MTHFSCIMTTFNDGPILRQSIHSILRQTYDDFELVLIDDGSSHETKEIIKEFTDPRIKVIPQSNDGLSSARNRGIQHAKGDFITFLDGDDVRSPWSFAEAASVTETADPDLIIVGGYFSGEDSRISDFHDAQVLHEILREASVDEFSSSQRAKMWAMQIEPQSANKFVSAKILKSKNIRFPNGYFFEDILFHTAVVCASKDIIFLPSSKHFTYFQRALRQQLTSSNNSIRFDVLASVKVALQILEKSSSFKCAETRSACVVSAFRLVQWCEANIAIQHRYSFRVVLKSLLLDLNPLFLSISANTPDPRGDNRRISNYLREAMQ